MPAGATFVRLGFQPSHGRVVAACTFRLLFSKDFAGSLTLRRAEGWGSRLSDLPRISDPRFETEPGPVVQPRRACNREAVGSSSLAQDLLHVIFTVCSDRFSRGAISLLVSRSRSSSTS